MVTQLLAAFWGSLELVGLFSVGLTASVTFPWPFYVFLHSLECFIPVLLSLKPLLCWVGQNLPALDLGQETKTFCFFFFFLEVEYWQHFSCSVVRGSCQGARNGFW